MAKKTVKTEVADSVGEVSPEIIGYIFGGRLFAEGYLATEFISFVDSGEVEHRVNDDVERLYGEVKPIIERFTSMESNGRIELNEDETQEKIIYPILDVLDWRNRTVKKSLSLSPADMRQVPDGLLFMDEESENKIYEEGNKKTPYKFGELVLENKKWRLPLEISQERLSAPAMQILSYLNRASVVSDSKIQWGFLTNGIEWRLYYQQAQSVAEQFFSVNLERLFGLGKQKNALEAIITDEDRLKCFKIFLSIFGKQAFKPAGIEYKSLHFFALQKVKLYQQHITDEITGKIFTEVFEKLAKTIAEQSPEVDGEQIKYATLKLLYRILFIFYAEDRDLLPINSNSRYKEHSLRFKVRHDIHQKVNESEFFFNYWGVIKSLCKVINEGNKDFSVPKYNGGLFKNDDAPLLDTIEINNKVLVEIIRPLSHLGKTYINYKNLNVEQLGSIYEQLLERDIIKQSDKSEIVVSGYDRRKSGSYYTPQELVNLVVSEAIDPLYDRHIKAFNEKAENIIDENMDDLASGLALTSADPAEAILQQKICDPSMGSGHFLVTLIDRLTDQAIKALGESENLVFEEWNYISPLRQRIEETRKTIQDNADKGGYQVNKDHLSDRHIVKRMVLKRCIYGVDKNSMAVELAKLALWLHTFTVGAPLSFLDHHLKCGDSIFGLTIQDVHDKIWEYRGLYIKEEVQEAIKKAAKDMKEINTLTDAEIEQVEQSERLYKEIQNKTQPAKNLLSFLHAFDWLEPDGINKEQKNERLNLLYLLVDRNFGDPIEILSDISKIPKNAKRRQEILQLITEGEELNQEEHFFHWQIEFPEVWKIHNIDTTGGFDAVVGNPPWNKMRLEEIEWFADRDSDIAKSGTQANRKNKIKSLKSKSDPLYLAYEKAFQRMKASLHVLRKAKIYSELNKGDLNIYKIFMERSRQLVSDEGYVSLVVPSGIASDKDAAPFFKKLVKNKQLISFYDFENGRGRYNRTRPSKEKLKPFFKDVSSQIKFCIFTNAKFVNHERIKYGCFLQRLEDLDNGDKCFPMSAEDFNLVNPNTGTAPIFRSQRDKELITSIYQNHVILKRTKSLNSQSIWDVDYLPMFHVSGDSNLFKNKIELENMDAYHIGYNRYKTKKGIWFPLYKGAMFNIHDHRAATIINNPDNLHVQRQPVKTDPEKYKDPNYFPVPYYWVLENDDTAKLKQDWVVAFRDVTNATSDRSVVMAILPKAGYDHTAPILINESADKKEYLLYANFNSIPLDYIARTKIHATHLTWFIVEQLPVIDVPVYSKKKFGDKTAEELIREIILELVYTAHNLESFAEDLGHVDSKGKAKKPFAWNEHRRLSLCAKLDAIYFILYGITEDADIDYIYSTFEITMKRQKEEFAGVYKSLELCKNYKKALLNGDSDRFFDV